MNDLLDVEGNNYLQSVCRQLAGNHGLELTPDECWASILHDVGRDWVHARLAVEDLANDRRMLNNFARSLKGECEAPPQIISQTDPIAIFSAVLVGFALGGFGMLIFLSMVK